eukprot:2352184-Rhodomonas_salina.1
MPRLHMSRACVKDEKSFVSSAITKRSQHAPLRICSSISPSLSNIASSRPSRCVAPISLSCFIQGCFWRMPLTSA